ncbi:hypothetical protein WN48_09707 [Eufriesea mexicana]|uniref:Uncharacterized protein n=1 Tax=Eufriesea mexicana TaxID=516756 RepID=A0A310SHC2_9HYME|nr:hypothetical protein WN48_09707 [Eufriesea mexicana]
MVPLDVFEKVPWHSRDNDMLRRCHSCGSPNQLALGCPGKKGHEVLQVRRIQTRLHELSKERSYEKQLQYLPNGGKHVPV